MKKLMMLFVLCALLVTPSALAIVLPERQSQHDLTYYLGGSPSFDVQGIGGRYVAISKFYPSPLNSVQVDIFDAVSGARVAELPISVIGTGYVPTGVPLLDFEDGYLLAQFGRSAPFSSNYQHIIWDVGNIEFIQLVNNIGMGLYYPKPAHAVIFDAVGANGGIFIMTTEGTQGFEQIRVTKVNVTGSYFVATLPCFVVEAMPDARKAICDDGKVIDYNDWGNVFVDYTIAGWTGNDIIGYNYDDENPVFITNEGKVVLFNEGTGQLAQSSVPSPLNESFLVFSRDNIVGEKDFLLSVWNSTNLLSTNVASTNYIVTSGDIFGRDHDNNFFMVDDATYELEYYTTEIGGAVIPDANTPPEYDLEWLGVDTNGKLVFTISMYDEEGGRVYRAIDVDKFPEEIDQTTVEDTIEFDTLADLSFVDGVFCSGNYGITFDTGIDFMDVDGALNISSELCVGGGYEIDFDDVTIVDDDEAYFATSISWIPINIFTNLAQGSISLYDEEGDALFHVIIETTFSNVGGTGTNNLNVSYWSGSQYLPLATGYTWDDGEVFTLQADIDFVAQTLDLQINDRFGGLIYQGSIPLLKNGVTGIGYANINGVLEIADQYTYVDYVSGSYTYSDDEPEYVFFDTLQAGGSATKTYRETPRGYGIYEVTLYGTDEELGLNYFENPVTMSINYQENTIVLDEEDIQDAVDDIQDEWSDETGGDDVDDGFTGGLDSPYVEGDLITDKVDAFLDAIGVKTTASRIVIGLILLIALVLVTGSWTQGRGDAMFYMGIIGTIGLAYLGFFPVWFMLVIVLVSLAVLASYSRSMLTGGGGG